MPSRFEIIEKIGKEYLTSNIENGEYSYPKALKNLGKHISKEGISSERGTEHQFIDIRFANDRTSILVETKDNFNRYKIEDITGQLQAYVNYERILNNNKIIAILADTTSDKIFTWFEKDGELKITNEYKVQKESILKPFEEYEDIFFGTKNDRLKVIQSTYNLNELLHKYGINEKLRSQFVGTCLLALKNNLKYEGLSTKQIISGIEEILNNLLEKDLKKAEKLVILKSKVLDKQDIRELPNNQMESILNKINDEILPYINDKNTMGQDLLNLFFTTFNKYVGKADKNQAFTPDHIVHFMCKAVGINRNSRVLDPCCGSGAFLVRALTEAMDDCDTQEEKKHVKNEQIYGIEYDEKVFGLATTNMLIHGDGNSNIRQGSCFENKEFISNAGIDVVLMNPPYNAKRKESDPTYVAHWKDKDKEDPSKGFYFVKYIADIIKKGKLAVLLPMQCAIGSSKELEQLKEDMLQKHTLDAVFSFPADMFHPGANANACCMIFNLGVRHDKAPIQETFFGYFKDDGFVKRKNLGRVQKVQSGEGSWKEIEKEWLSLYFKRKSKQGLSVTCKVNFADEWLAEAYMETDYSVISCMLFKKTIKEILSFKILVQRPFNIIINEENNESELNIEKWKYFYVDKLFNIIPTLGKTTDDLIDGDEVPYISAKHENNGLEYFVAKKGNESFISEGNCIIFIQLGAGSAGFTTYQPYPFIGMNGKTTCGYSQHLNVYTGAFIKTILDLERPKYSYGRSWTGDRLKSTKIKLPATLNPQTNEYEPDWRFMEDYIKSLPYGDCL